MGCEGGNGRGKLPPGELRRSMRAQRTVAVPQVGICNRERLLGRQVKGGCRQPDKDESPQGGCPRKGTGCVPLPAARNGAGGPVSSPPLPRCRHRTQTGEGRGRSAFQAPCPSLSPRTWAMHVPPGRDSARKMPQELLPTPHMGKT